jgi:hypothetical protein
MKFLRLLSLFFLLLSFTSNSQEKLVPNDWQKQDLKGKVKAVNTKVCSFIPNGDSYQKQCATGSCKYNSRGQIIEQSESDPPYRETFIYNTKGQLVLSKRFSKETGKSSKDTFIYSTNVKADIPLYQGKRGLPNYTKYDGNGNELEYSITFVDSTVRPLRKFVYDKNNRVIQAIHYDLSTANINHNFKRQYDNKGNMIMQTDSATSYSYTCKYNEKNLMIEQTNGNNVYKLKYDDHGNHIEYAMYDEKGALVFKSEWKFTYDSVGNKTKTMEYRNAVLISTIEQTYSYY